MRWLRPTLFVGTALLFGAFLKLVWEAPWVGIAAVLAVGVAVAWRAWSRARFVRLLRRGDVGGILSEWRERLEDMPHPKTMAPLLTATAFAAYGRTRDARRAMASAERGPAWEAAIEHRLFLEALLTTFEGDVDEAWRVTLNLSALPLPRNAVLRDRVTLLRQALLALVRAFQHKSLPGDIERLEAASQESPLIHWVMRYGAAVVAIDHQQLDKARALIDGAPAWPDESAFRSFHDEISGMLPP